MQAHFRYLIRRRFPGKNTRTAPVAIIGVILLFALATASSAALVDSNDQYRPYSLYEMKFLEGHLLVGSLSIDEESSEMPSRATITREQIEFLESNWYLDRGEFMYEWYVPENPTSAVSEPHRHERLGEGLMTNVSGADERGQREALTPELEANLDAFDRMERAPGLYTDPSDVSEAATAAQIRANLDAFDRMEQTPGSFTEVSKEHALTHPWGGDALTPDY